MSAAMALQALQAFAADIEEDLDADPNLTDSPEALAIVLGAIRDCRADLATLYSIVEKKLLAVAGERRFTVDGFGEVEVRRSNKRTAWDNDGLTRTLVAMALDERIVNEETGEYEPAHEAVARVLAECARPSWRVTPLRARNIDETEYCTVEEGAYSVQLPPRKVD